MAKGSTGSSEELQQALDRAGFSAIQCVADLGFVSWCPPPRNTKKGAPYRYKVLAKATMGEIQHFTVSDRAPDCMVDVASLRLPVPFKTNLPKQVVAQKFPYGKIGIASLYHARSKKNCDLKTIDFYFGCSALEILSAEKKTGKNDRAPYLIIKVPGTNILMLHYDLSFGQDYSVPGFQFERLMSGHGLASYHNVGFTEHVQIMQIGPYRVLMTAETDAVDKKGNPVEMKLTKKGGSGGTKVFFQMIGSGSLSLCKGRHVDGVLTSVETRNLIDMAQSIAENHDASSLEQKLIRNMERLKEWDRQGFFTEGKAYRVDFNPGMELHPVSRRDALLPSDSVVKELLGISG